ncbi:hypothetical protein [Mobilicoccus massiliensis]|uniref:hypothetical protein n=1 Tax=Mobilicoccus massiliensis TaxID=1522310 RepID=UPI0005906B5C|nr:hypothetical protein [Mobilicoccus massiliensis]
MTIRTLRPVEPGDLAWIEESWPADARGAPRRPATFAAGVAIPHGHSPDGGPTTVQAGHLRRALLARSGPTANGVRGFYGGGFDEPWDPPLDVAVAVDRDVRYRFVAGTLADLTAPWWDEALAGEFRCFLWPADRSWLLYASPDLPTGFVFGDDALAASLLATPGLAARPLAASNGEGFSPPVVRPPTDGEWFAPDRAELAWVVDAHPSTWIYTEAGVRHGAFGRAVAIPHHDRPGDRPTSRQREAVRRCLLERTPASAAATRGFGDATGAVWQPPVTTHVEPIATRFVGGRLGDLLTPWWDQEMDWEWIRFLWPADRSWLVERGVTDRATLIGGDDPLIAALLADPHTHATLTRDEPARRNHP